MKKMTEEELYDILAELTNFVQVQANLDERMALTVQEIAVRITALEKVIEDWEKRGS